MDVAVSGLGGPVAEYFDSVVRNSLSGGNSGGTFRNGVARVTVRSLIWIRPDRDGGVTRSMWRLCLIRR